MKGYFLLLFLATGINVFAAQDKLEKNVKDLEKARPDSKQCFECKTTDEFQLYIKGLIFNERDPRLKKRIYYCQKCLKKRRDDFFIYQDEDGGLAGIFFKTYDADLELPKGLCCAVWCPCFTCFTSNMFCLIVEIDLCSQIMTSPY